MIFNTKENYFVLSFRGLLQSLEQRLKIHWKIIRTYIIILKISRSLIFKFLPLNERFFKGMSDFPTLQQIFVILENVSEYKMFIEKNVIQLAGALVSCNLIGFRLSVIGREYSPKNRNIHLTCGVSCISMLRVLFYIYLLFPIKIYPTGRFNLNKESVC